jgi:serine/threonine-protein kinase
MHKKLGKYEIIEELGKGAMGVVYKAFDPLMARYVALKTMSHTDANDPEFKKRFYKEAQAPGRLHHEHIVIIYELNEDQGIPFIAMEYLEGTDLHRLIQSDYIFTLKKILDIMAQVCEGLNYAHQNGIIHRDVKPANIFLLKNGKVKIVDFGIAQISQSSLMTRTGMILGTPSYMAPEQVRAEGVGGASDQFSVGVILFELLTGRRPFEGDTYSTIMYKILHDPPPRIRDFYPTCPAELEELVLKMLGKESSERFVDLTSVARRLRKIEADLAQDVQVEGTIAITRASTMDKSLNLELIHRYLREEKFDLARRVLDKMKSLGETPEIVEALAADIQEKQRLARIDQLVDEGSHFYEDDHFDLALECFNDALALDSENTRVLEWVRKTHEREAEKRLRQAIDQYLEKGDRLVGDGKPQEALRVYSEAVKLNPASTAAAERIRNVQGILEQEAQRSQCQTLCQQARSALDKGERAAATQLCREALDIMPAFADASDLLASIQAQNREEKIQRTLQEMESFYLKKEYDRALTRAGEAIDQVGLDPRLKHSIGKTQWARRRRVIVPAALLAVALLAAAGYWLVETLRPPVGTVVPGFLVVDIRPGVEILQLTDVRTGQPVRLSDRQTPIRLSLPPGEYRLRYQNKELMREAVEETVTVRGGQLVTVSKKVPGFNPTEAVDSILGEGAQP